MKKMAHSGTYYFFGKCHCGPPFLGGVQLWAKNLGVVPLWATLAHSGTPHEQGWFELILYVFKTVTKLLQLSILKFMFLDN